MYIYIIVNIYDKQNINILLDKLFVSLLCISSYYYVYKYIYIFIYKYIYINTIYIHIYRYFFFLYKGI